jgi:hypothetical protein
MKFSLIENNFKGDFGDFGDVDDVDDIDDEWTTDKRQPT